MRDYRRDTRRQLSTLRGQGSALLCILTALCLLGCGVVAGISYDRCWFATNALGAKPGCLFFIEGIHVSQHAYNIDRLLCRQWMAFFAVERHRLSGMNGKIFFDHLANTWGRVRQRIASRPISALTLKDGPGSIPAISDLETVFKHRTIVERDKTKLGYIEPGSFQNQQALIGNVGTLLSRLGSQNIGLHLRAQQAQAPESEADTNSTDEDQDPLREVFGSCSATNVARFAVGCFSLLLDGMVIYTGDALHLWSWRRDPPGFLLIIIGLGLLVGPIPWCGAQ
jgi:hypothetical protein